MKKYLLTLIALLLSLCLICTAMAAEGPFTPGEDETEYEVDGASGWTKETVFVKIVAGEDVLYDGTVTLTSDNVLVSEFTYAAIVEAGIGAEGLLEGFATSIGDYVSGNDADGNYLYWGFSVNGKYVPVACNLMPVLEGDYILWEFIKYDPEAGFDTEVKPCGFDAPFEVGEDETEYVVDGASGWTTTTANVKITAGDDVLYNGTVTLTSDNALASEFTYAAIVEAGIGAEGLLEGFATSIGDYVAGNDADGNYLFWGFSVNGKYAPLACNQIVVLEGDYISWDYQVYTAE